MIEVDPVTGSLMVTGGGKRLGAAEVAVIRQAQAAGRAVVFANRHQWRHFQRHP